jgi:hypothetical protein
MVSVHVQGPAPGHVALPSVTAFAPRLAVLNADKTPAVKPGVVVLFNVNTIFVVDDDT